MIIRTAELHEFDELMAFYDEMCKSLDDAPFLPDGNKGGFPSRELVAESLHNKQVYAGLADNRIMAAYILNHQCDAAYSSVGWQIAAAPDEVSILHALRIAPAYHGRGYARRLIEHAIRIAGERHQKAIRLDCLEGNAVPQRMYLSYGFQSIDTVNIFYEDIGIEQKFCLYELVL